MSVPLPPVLLVDDEKNMRLSLQAMLADEGYDARAVESAEEGLSLLAREKFFMIDIDPANRDRFPVAFEQIKMPAGIL